MFILVMQEIASNGEVYEHTIKEYVESEIAISELIKHERNVKECKGNILERKYILIWRDSNANNW